MGLTLARTVIELHGGTIIAQSEGPGRGSEFVVRLPVGAPVEPAGPDDRRPVAIEARQILLVEDDGYEVGRRIRAGLGSRALLVALTAHDLEEDRSTETGFDAHLVKPASYEDLTHILGRGRRGD